MKKTRFDTDGFYAALDSQKESRGLTWKEVAKEAKISASTLTRMGQGKRPDVDSLTALARWSGLSADKFIGNSGKNAFKADPLAQITTILRSDKNLSTDSKLTLDAVIKATYGNLRIKDESK